MPDQTQPDQQFEDSMATIFTCRSVVKYNSRLNEEQKKELIADIDAALRFLRSRANELVPAASLSPPLPQAETQAPFREAQADHSTDEQKLQALYHMYHAYLGLQQNNLGTFMTRFNDVMSTMGELQNLLAQRHDSYVSAEPPIERVSGFITDLYYIFVEFIRTLSQVLEANDVHLDTEEVVAMQERSLAYDMQTGALCNITPLLKVFEAHQLLNARKGPVSGRVDATTAFLEFLEESLTADYGKRDEIIAQLNSTAALLKDLSQLLAGYELALSALVNRH
jgi:hypothetical protein